MKDDDGSPQPVPKPTAINRFASACAEAILNPELRRGFLAKTFAKIRRYLRVITGTYFILLFGFCVAIHWWAEKNMVLAFFAFLPAILWILPAAALALLSIPFSRRLFLVQCLGIAAYAWFFMDYDLPSTGRPAPAERTLNIISYNRGQSRNHSLEPFKNEIQPDIIVLQEAFGRANLYRADQRYKEYPHIRGLSQFLVLSKFPVTKAGLVPLPASGKRGNISARFEVDFHGQPIALYAVHMPTLRDTLGYYRRGALLYGFVGLPFTPWNEARKKQQDFWRKRTHLAGALAEAIASDELPAIAAGDFNMPDHGVIYHHFANRFTDAHEKRGRGFGYTFPGTSERFQSGYGPWLRLDYIFTDRSWNTLRFTTEKESVSQHRAIAATLALEK